ncbi:MAG: hypothetical protein R2733_14405 [Acidimicrobiales bacterium]
MPARVGLLGNPSDGYGGRTLGLAVDAFSATVTLTPTGDQPERRGITLVPHDDDRASWRSSAELADHLDRFGYGTGPQVMAAAVRTFIDVTRGLAARGETVRPPEDFELRYETTIPRQVGLAGSSALVIATLRCLMTHSGLDIPDAVLASLALRAETEQLGITAGLQDRVVQTHGGLVAMDFSHLVTEPRFGVAHGHYEAMDPALLPPLFLAYLPASAEPSGAYHGTLRARFDAGDTVVRSTLRELAALVTEGRAALRWHNAERFGELVAANMELRRRLGPLPERQVALVDMAGELDAPATFAGSGGAVVGVATDEDHLDRLDRTYRNQGAHFLRL